jgi:cytochrome c oxidase subunit III
VSQPSRLRVGVVVWLASELMFFGGLFAAYFGLRAINDPWPPSAVHLDLPRIAVFTALLVSSSFSMRAAVSATESGNRRRGAGWTLVTFALGAAFLANQAAEFATSDFSVSDHAYGSIFYLMTGFHGLHVAGGLVLMLAVLGVGLGRSSRAPFGESLTVTEYYWHFVDVVWVGMFATIYLVR